MVTRHWRDSAHSARFSSPTVNFESFVSSFPRSIGTLLTTPVNDGVILLRDIAGDAATEAAKKVNPSDEQLSQIDKPADDNTWHDVPDMSAGNIKSQIKDQYNTQKPFSKGDLRDAAGNANQAANPEGSRDPAHTAELARHEQQIGANTAIDGQAGVENGAATLRQRASENVPEETKDRARQRQSQTKNYLSKKMPEERREQTIWRLKKLVVEVQGHPDCKF